MILLVGSLENKLLREEGKRRRKWAAAPFKDIRHPHGVTPHSILPRSDSAMGRRLAGTRRDTCGFADDSTAVLFERDVVVTLVVFSYRDKNGG